LSPDLNSFASLLPEWLVLTGAFLLAFSVTFFPIPTIVKIAKHKKIFNVPNGRSSHNNDVPMLGGLAIFGGLTISSIVFTLPSESEELRFILGGVIVLFFLGLKDDVLRLVPKKKLIGQIVSSLFVIILGDIRIIDFHTILGIDSISYVPGILVTLILFLTLINGFNLIDGVDGLSAGVGILSGTFYAAQFIIMGHLSYAVISLSLTGALVAYFWFNVFGKKNKIFMGDTGSIITGLIISVLTVHFLENSEDSHIMLKTEAAPAIAFGLLILPLFDTLRVFLIRIALGQSPFKADKRHIHHLLLRLGFSHINVTISLLAFNFIILVISLFFQSVGSLTSILILLMISTIATFLVRDRVKTSGIRLENEKE